MLETPHSGATGRGEIKLVLTLKLTPYWLVSRVLDGAIWAAGREKNQPSYAVVNPASYNDKQTGKNVPSGATVAPVLRK